MITARGEVVTKPENIAVSITLTMNLEEWNDLAKALPEAYPHWQVARLIRDVISKVTRQVVEHTEDLRG